jgi:CRP-like cAMP-binding protein
MGATDPLQVPLFAALKTKDRENVLKHAKRRTFAAGDVVVREGQEAIYLFIVADGRARVEREGVGEVGRLGRGDFFGELALIEEHARTATVVAEDDLTCYLIPAWEFRALLAEHPEMALPMLKAVIARLHQREHHGS